jgi:DNA-binding MarR family transcriptional regulator
MDEVDSTRLTAWQGFLFAHAAVIRALGAELEAAHDLPLTWYDVLVNLDEAAEDRLRLHQLAERVVLSQSGVSRLVDRMEDAGLVERVPDERDARVIWAVLTDHGRAVLEAAAPTHHRGIARHFAAHLSDEEAGALVSAFERILEALDSPRRPQPPRR